MIGRGDSYVKVLPDIFQVGHGSDSEFCTDEFTDVSDLHQYFLTSKKNSEDFVDKYEALNAVLDFYSDLRAIAEEECEKLSNIRIYSKKNEVPISLEAVSDYFENRSEVSEPPLRLITRIALYNFHQIYALVNGMHKVLQRDRQFVSIDRVQQQDTQCIRWLIKQPGRNTIERAGNRQRILGVVRYETCNTLENRVLKHFLQLVLVECDRYLRQYRHVSKPDSERINAVETLRNLANFALRLPEFKSIGNLYSIPKPNYVLRNNALYRIVWEHYLQLLSKTRMIESVWAKRHIVFHELVQVMFLAICHKNCGADSPIEHFLWLRQFADESGHFFTPDSFLYLDYSYKRGVSYRYLASEEGYITMLRNDKKDSYPRLEVFFVPDEYYIRADRNHRIIYYEDGVPPVVDEAYKNHIVVPSADVVKDVYDAVGEVLR